MAERAESRELVVAGPAGVPTLLPMPAAALIVLCQTPNAAFAAEEFFQGHPQQRTHPVDLRPHSRPLLQLVR